MLEELYIELYVLKTEIGNSPLFILLLRLARATAILAPTNALFFTSAISEMLSGKITRRIYMLNKPQTTVFQECM